MRTDLRDARIKLGLSQTDVAAAIGRDQGTVSRYESGATEPDKDVAAALAEVLQLPVLQVLYPDAPAPKKGRAA